MEGLLIYDLTCVGIFGTKQIVQENIMYFPYSNVYVHMCMCTITNAKEYIPCLMVANLYAEIFRRGLSVIWLMMLLKESHLSAIVS